MFGKEFFEKQGAKWGFDFWYFARNGFWTLLRQIAGLGSGFLLTVAFARLASQETFGQYQFVLSVLAIISVFSLPGLNQSIVQSAARGKDGDFPTVVRTSFYWSLLGVPALLILGLYYYWNRDFSLGLALMSASVFFPLLYAPNTWDSFLQGKSLFKTAAKFGSWQAALNLIFVAGSVFWSRGKLLPAVLAYCFSQAALNGWFFWRSLKYSENSEKDPETVKYGWFLTGVNVFSLIADNIDRIIVGVFLGPKALAVYFLGISVVKNVFDFSKTFVSVLAPKIAVKNTVIFKKYLILFLTLLPVSAAIFFLLPVVVPLIFSEKYASSVGLAQIAIIFLPVVFVNLLYLSHFIYFVKNKKLIAWHTISLSLLKLIFIVPLMIFWGTKGLAFMFGFQTIASLGILLFLDKIFSEKPKKII